MNVVLITIDSLRADHVGWMGYERDTTPNLDEWANQSYVFENCFSLACATRPSFPAILSSVHPLMYGGYARIHDSQTLVSEALPDHTCGGFHSNLYLSAEFGYDRGWAHFYDSSERTTTGRLRQWVKNNIPSNNPIYRVLDWAHSKTEESIGVNVGSYYTPGPEITDRALAWEKNQTGPTFLWVHYMDPHHPYIPEKQYFSDVPQRRGVQLRQKMLKHQDSEEEIVSDEELETIIALYDDEIRNVDSCVDKLLTTLDSRWDEWTGIVTADHGEEFLDHGEFSHSNYFYDETMHVPLFVYTNGKSGHKTDLVSTADIPPTITDVTGMNTPDSWIGSSLVTGSGHDHVVGGWGSDRFASRPWRLACRTLSKKYIRDDIGGREIWYDLIEDPDEHNPQSDPPEELVHVVDTWEQRIDATQPETEHESEEIDERTAERLQRLGYRE